MSKKLILLVFILNSFNTKCLSQSSFVQTWFTTGVNFINSFLELADSSFILVGGESTNMTTQAQGVILRCSFNGDSIYTFLYDSSLFFGLSLASDSEVLVSGGYFSSTKGYVSTTKINFISGDTIFCKYYGPIDPQSAPYILNNCDDNGYIMLNYQSGSYGFIKLDSNANVQWHTYHNMAYQAQQIKPDPLGGFVAVGNRGYVSDPYAVQRLDSVGSIIWNYGYGNVPFTAYDDNYYCTDVVIAADSNYIIACKGPFMSLMKINRINGDTIWTKINPIKPHLLINNAGIDTYITVTDSFGLIDGNGNFIWQTKIVPNGFNISHCAKTFDGGFAFSGWMNNGQTMVFVKLDSTGHTVNTSLYDLTQQKQVYFYPNPVSDVLNYSGHTAGKFTFSVYSFTGSKVISVKNKNAVDVSALPAGFYVAEVKEGGKVIREKFVKE